MADRQVTFPCSVNSIPFYPAVSDRRAIDAIPNQGHAAYIDSQYYWQAHAPYQCKCLFTDTLTFQFKTQSDGTLSRLYVYDSIAGPDNHPIPNQVVAAFTTPLQSGTEYYGRQIAPYDFYIDPVLGSTQVLASYMWSFRLGAYLTSPTDSGIYFVVFDNVNDAGTHQLWYSEPILLFGTDAKDTATTNTTLVFEATNNSNQGDIIINNWPNQIGRKVIFHVRAEADIMDWDSKSVYLGYYQENYNQLMTYAQIFDVFVLNVGSINKGIPAVLFKIIAAFIGMDNLTINNKYYTYDFGEGTDNPAIAWKITKDRTNLLQSGTLAIREKYSNEFFAPGIDGGRYHSSGFAPGFN